MNAKESAASREPIRAFGMTDVGQKRKVNQDQFLIAQLNKSMLVTSTSLPLHQQSRLYGAVQGHLFLVADGMGGHAAGEKASSLAIDNLVTQLLNRIHWFFQVDHDCEEDFVDDLKELLKNTHQRILDEASSNADQLGMGTTLTMAHVVWPRLYVVHAGDSRCYLIRQGECHQLTTDHTLARRLVEAGGLRPEDEATSRWSNVLWNVLGGKNEEEGLIAEVRRTDLQEGDTVLLCSDGLYRYLDCDDLANEISQGTDLRSTCQRLIDLANQAGGEDNITVVVAQPTPPISDVDEDELVPEDDAADRDTLLSDTVDDRDPKPTSSSPNQNSTDFSIGDSSHHRDSDASGPDDDDGLDDTLPG